MMRFVRTFAIVCAQGVRLIAIKEVRNYGKIVSAYIKNMFENSWWRMHTPCPVMGFKILRAGSLLYRRLLTNDTFSQRGLMSVKKVRTGSLIFLTFQERVRANPCELPESHHCPCSIPPGYVLVMSYRNHQKSQAYFSHLATLILFFFTKKRSQKRGAWHNAPL